MWLLSIYRPTVSNRKVTLSEAPRANPEDVLKQAHEKGIELSAKKQRWPFLFSTYKGSPLETENKVRRSKLAFPLKKELANGLARFLHQMVVCAEAG